MSKAFKLKALSIVLKRHNVSELKKIYQEVIGEKAPSDISHFQLVKDLSTKTKFSELESDWADKLYANNTTIKVYRFVDDKGNRYQNGLNILKRKFSPDSWKKLCTKGYSPNQLRDKTQLMHVSNVNDKSFFLFVSPGRNKEVVQDLTVKYLQQPQFTIAVWYNKESLLQVRGLEKASQVVLEVIDYFKVSTGKYPSTKQAEIPDRTLFNKLKGVLKGRGTKGRYSNPTEEVTEVTLKANADKELLNTKRSKSLIDDKYNLNAAGIDFDYNNKGYTVWIGFKLGTFWIRSGDVTEDVLDYIQEKILSVTKV